MGRKSSSKGQAPQAAPVAKKQGFNPLLIGAALIVVVGVGVLAFWRSDPTESLGAAAPAASAEAPAQSPAADARAIAKAEAAAKLGPRTQANLPPVPFQGYAPPRAPEVITAAYQFAAEHPEVLSYVPCFCGCEQAGHSGNHDCFVRQRAENGDVIAWDEHGVECAVCIDVATRSRQLHASGASVQAIRAAIDKEFGTMYPGRMPTPHPPSHDH